MSALEVQSVLQKMAMMRDERGGWPPGAQLEFQELYTALEKVQRKVMHAEPLVDSRSSVAYSTFLDELRHVALTIDEALDQYSAGAIRSPYRHKFRGLLTKAFVPRRPRDITPLTRALMMPFTVLTALPRSLTPLTPALFRPAEHTVIARQFQEVMRPKISGQFKEAGKVVRLLLRLFTTYVADLLPPPPELQRQDSGLSGSTASNNKKALSLTLSHDHGLIGRGRDQANVSRLLQEGGARVVAIVGMAGVGKTALARAVSAAAQNYGFDHTLWVDVSQDFDPEGIFRLVMSQLQEHQEDPESYWWSLNEGLINRRCLLVLDDVWNEDPGKWNQLMHLLYGDVMNRGKILVTTRTVAAAVAIRATETYQLRPLSVGDTLKLLGKNNKRQVKKLLKKNKKLHRGHKSAATISTAAAERSNERQVAERCSGLPCIINFMRLSLADLCKKEVADPLKQFDSLCAKNEELHCIAQASYDYLPADLQRCLLYCSLFPHDHIFDTEEMTGLMVAEGLTQISSSREAGKKGGGIIRLLSECFDAVEKPGSKGEVGYKIHHVLHILARHKEKGLYKAITRDDHSNGLRGQSVSHG